MANSRSIITWETVLKAKQRYEIKNMLIENYKALYGADINIDVRTADAGWIDSLTDILYDFSLLAVNVYNSFDISNAKGALLDNLVLLSGNLIRHTPTKTKVQCKLTFGSTLDDDISYSYNTNLLSCFDIENKKWTITPVDQADTVIYYNGVYPADHPTKANEDQLVFLEHSYAGTYLIPNDPNPIIEIRKDGSFETNSNILINNMIMVNRGTEIETDSQLKARKKDSLAYNSTSLIDSIRDSVLNNIYSIKDVLIYNSSTLTPLIIDLWNGTGLIADLEIPNHDVFVLVKPAEGVVIQEGQSISRSLVDVLRRKITLGISTFQDIPTGDPATTYFGETEIDPNYDSNYHKVTLPVDNNYINFTETYRYYVAQQYKPYIKLNITAIPNSGFNLARTKERIIKALYEYASDYPINKNINKSELSSIAASAGNLDPLNPTCRIDSVDISIDATINAGDNDIFVNNGYWFIDLIDELDESLDKRLTFNVVT